MKVPYAERWQKEADMLRQIALDCDLTEELKWGKPCFTFLKKNVAIVILLKESCAFSFFKGALLKDPQRVLERIGEHRGSEFSRRTTSIRPPCPLEIGSHTSGELPKSSSENPHANTPMIRTIWSRCETACRGRPARPRIVAASSHDSERPLVRRPVRFLPI